ncbi:OmpA family protein [Runella zeae]|uniref:OmpA family protein n=1 Tax=Runella zeae TaxID=94255 RepID=UPI00041E1E57|nr:OmpA family protein [Runella zeae]
MKKILILLLITLSTQAQQKKGLLERINEGLQKVNTTLETGKAPSSSGGTSRSIFSAGKTIRGEWKEYGAGGTNTWNWSSPRNHIYSITINQDMPRLNMSDNSNGFVGASLFSSNGQRVWSWGSAWIDNVKAGNYKLCVYGERYERNNYEINFEGSISNVQLLPVEYVPMDNSSFGEEGGGGGSYAWYSPRNQLYLFEPERDSHFDINVESTGLPIFIRVVSPSGKIMNHVNTNSPGVEYCTEQAKEKGIYKIIIGTNEVNARGEYKIEAVGKFIKKPERLPSQEQKITQKWTRQSIKHVYTLPAQVGYQEVMLRTTEGECNLSVTDAFGQQVDAHRNLHSPGLKNAIFECKTAGNYKVTVETTNPNGGEYELLFFGKFGEISGQNLKVAAPTPRVNNSINYQNGGGGSYTNQTTTTVIDQTIVNEPEPVTSTTVEEVIIRGQVSNQANAQNLRVIYYNLATNEQLGEIPVAANGSYQFALPRGQRYSLQVVGDGEFVASSQNIDLRETKVVKGKPTPQIKNYTVREVVTMPIEAGSTITLNNLFFPNGKYTLLPESYAELNRLTELMEANPSVKVEIAGHTDNVGGDVPNQELSQDRAEAVRSYLLSKGISSIRLRAKGYGKARPIAPNTTEDGKAQNRRVEFVILGR